jgi:hypothetical protein
VSTRQPCASSGIDGALAAWDALPDFRKEAAAKVPEILKKCLRFISMTMLQLILFGWKSDKVHLPVAVGSSYLQNDVQS